MAKGKLTRELVDQAVSLKGDGLNDADIIRALGIAPSTFYRWLKDPQTRLQRALKDGLKKAESEYKRTLLTTIRNAALEKTGNWTAAAWLLERKFPEEFAQTQRSKDEREEAAPQILLGVKVETVGEGAQVTVADASTPLLGMAGEAADD